MATFSDTASSLGTYVLALTAVSDQGQLSTNSQVTITLVSADVFPYQASNYLYTYAATDILTNFYATNLDDSTWTNGQAGFGNTNGCPLVPNTGWPGYVHGSPWLYLRRHFTVPVGTTNLSLTFKADNDAQIFLNGSIITPTNILFNGASVTQNVAQVFYRDSDTDGFSTNFNDANEVVLTNVFFHGNCSAYDDFILNGLSPNVWHTNDNIIAVKVYDDGKTSFFDTRLSIISSSPP